MAVRKSLAAVQRLQGFAGLMCQESRPSTIGPITLEVKQNRMSAVREIRTAAFDVAGAGKRGTVEIV